MGESGRERRRILVDRKFQLGLSLQIVGFVYMYLVLFALLANVNALKAVIYAEHQLEPIAKMPYGSISSSDPKN